MSRLQRTSVLHVGKFYPPAPGGMERIVQLLCEGEQETTDSRVLVANTGPGTIRETWDGIDVIRVSSLGAIGSVGICPMFPFELARASRDVTVIHEPNPLALVSDWITAQNGPLVVWFHSEVIRPRWKYRLLYRPFLRRVLRRASRIVVSSPNLVEHAAELQDFRDKCVVIPFGIDLQRLERSPVIDAKVEAISARFPGPRVLFVGRLVEYKGVEYLIRAMQNVDATALIVGQGPLRGSLEALASGTAAKGRIHFLGPLSDDDVIAQVHACDVFVLPSITRAETFGVVQLEAMACAKPVVSTNLPTGVPWVNRHGETGLVVEPADAAALATALNDIIGDSDLRQRMGEAARLRVVEHFTTHRMTRESASLYRDVALGKAPASQPQTVQI